MKPIAGWTVAAFFVMTIGCGAGAVESEPVAGEGDAPSPEGAQQEKETSSTSTPATPEKPKTPSSPTKTLELLTYNVAGLPQAISSVKPAENTKKISPLLNPFDLVLVQEDFAYHDDLVSAATHPHKTPAMKALSPTDLGDGLNALARSPVSGLARTKWKQCSGYFDQKNDCLTSKGFASFTIDLGDGFSVDVYDVHFDAGRSDGDSKARYAQVAQLASAINAQSKDRAVIVAGDTNMKDSDEATFQALLTNASLSCACRVLKCPEAARIDRVMFRSSSSIAIVPKSYQVESFVDAKGEPLSDHEPVNVVLELSKP